MACPSADDAGGDEALRSVLHTAIGRMANVRANLDWALGSGTRGWHLRHVDVLERSLHDAMWVTDAIADLARGLPAAAFEALLELDTRESEDRLTAALPGALVRRLDHGTYRCECQRCGWHSHVIADLDRGALVAANHRRACPDVAAVDLTGEPLDPAALRRHVALVRAESRALRSRSGEMRQMARTTATDARRVVAMCRR